MSVDLPSSMQWFETVRDITTRLVGVRSVSPSPDEDNVTNEVVRILGQDGLASTYGEIGLDALAGDAYGRHNAYAYLPGATKRTVILLGHIDTVATADYGALEPFALDTEALGARLELLKEITPGLEEALGERHEDWMFGRGTIDMKSGVAANIAVMRALAALPQDQRPLSVALLATPDEENESAGVLQAVRFLTALRQRHGLRYVGAINTDYTTARYAGDARRYIYMGTIGKLLASFFVAGREGHVGDPFQGLDVNVVVAELVRDLSMNTDLCERIGDRSTPPPVTLHASDLKMHYDVQLPYSAYFHLNLLTFKRGPAEAMAELKGRAEEALRRVLNRVAGAEQGWRLAQGTESRGDATSSLTGTVITYAELTTEAEARLTPDELARAMDEEWRRWPADLDKRERALHMVERLWTLSGRSGPAVVLYFSPPYYPHVGARPCALHAAARKLVARHPELNLSIEEYYPYLSDMSYLRVDEGIDVHALVQNMPVWVDSLDGGRGGGYSLPLDDIRSLDAPVVNLGPYGGGAHQRGERLLMPYSFDTLPRLICEMIDLLAGMGNDRS